MYLYLQLILYLVNYHFNIVTSLPSNTIIKGKHKTAQNSIPFEGVINLQTVKPIKMQKSEFVNLQTV